MFKKNRNYVITRAAVCAGELIQISSSYQQALDENFQELTEQQIREQGLITSLCFPGLICRSMLFSVNEQGLSNDLIYDSPQYPIVGIKPPNDVSRDFVILKYVQLEKALKYLRYNKKLTQEDLEQVFDTVIKNQYWLHNNLELFGFRKEKTGYYRPGKKEIIPYHIYEQLDYITATSKIKPHPEEPNYKLIKKR